MLAKYVSNIPSFIIAFIIYIPLVFFAFSYYIKKASRKKYYFNKMMFFLFVILAFLYFLLIAYFLTVYETIFYISATVPVSALIVFVYSIINRLKCHKKSLSKGLWNISIVISFVIMAATVLLAYILKILS